MIRRAIGVLFLAPLAGFAVEAAAGAGAFEFPASAWVRTLAVAVTATALSLLVGVPAGIVLAHTRRRAALALTLVPLFMPPALAGSVWAALRLPPPGVWACGVILAAVHWPVVALIAAASLRNLPRTALEAAELSGAGALRAVAWPHARPALAAAALLVFVLSASEFTVPSTFAVPTVSYVIFTHLSAFRTGTAAAVALPLAALAIGFVWAARRVPALPSPGEPRPFLRGGPLAACGTVTGAAWAATAIAPAVVWALSIRNVATASRSFSLHAESLAWGLALAAGIALVLVTWASLTPRRSALEPLWLLTLLLPGAVAAMGTLALAGRAGAVSLLSPSGALLALALLGRYAAVAWLALREPVASPQLEAAELAGLSPTRTWWTIVRPELLPRAAAAGALVFVFALGDVACAEFLSPPGRQMPVLRIFSLMHFGYDETVAALALSLFGAAVLAAWGISYVGRIGRAAVAR